MSNNRLKSEAWEGILFCFLLQDGIFSRIRCVHAFDVYNLMTELQQVKANIIHQVIYLYNKLKLTLYIR
jgi:hypothetical protein